MGSSLKKVIEDCNIGEAPAYLKEYVEGKSLPFDWITASPVTADTYVVYSGNEQSTYNQSLRKNGGSAKYQNAPKRNFLFKEQQAEKEEDILQSLVQVIASSERKREKQAKRAPKSKKSKGVTLPIETDNEGKDTVDGNIKGGAIYSVS